MAVCANCSRALQPEWKFCIYCGTPTGVGQAEPIEDTSPVLRAEDIPADEPEPAPAAIRPAASAVSRVNILAVLALILGCLVSPLAALFGHLALNQLKTSGERGVIPAWIAVVLGYLWLGFWIVFGVTYFATNG